MRLRFCIDMGLGRRGAELVEVRIDGEVKEMIWGYVYEACRFKLKSGYETYIAMLMIFDK